MQLPAIDLWIIVLYFVGMLVFGGWISRRVKTEKDYFLAGRSLPFWVIGMSIVVSDIGAVDFVSLGGQAYDYGVVAANMDWIGTMPAIILAAFIFVPYYWRAGVYSVPEYLGRRFHPSVRAIQSIVWTLFLVVNLGAIFWATAKMFEGLLGHESWAGLAAWLDSMSGGDWWTANYAGEVTEQNADASQGRLMAYVVLAAVITGFYTISGGLTAVVYTDAIQLVLMFLGAILVIAIGLADPAVGGVVGLRETVDAAGHTDHFSLLLPHDSKTPYPWTGVFVGLALVLAPAYFIGNQAIVQRTLGARDEWSAKAGTLFGGLLKFCIPILVVLPGLIALVKYPTLQDGQEGFGMLVKELLPTGVRGLVIAGFLAALMSSVDSVLTSAATILTRDVWVGLLKRPMTDRQLLRMGRWLTFALVIFGASTARLSETKFESIYAAIQSTLSIIQGPTLALLLGGMFWRRATSAGAVASLIVGMALALGLHSWQKAEVDKVERTLGSTRVVSVHEDEGEPDVGTLIVCDALEGNLVYRDRVVILRTGGDPIGRGSITLLRGLPGSVAADRSSDQLAEQLGANLREAEAGKPVVLRLSIDWWKVGEPELAAGDRVEAFESSAPFHAAEPFFFIAAIAFVVSLLTLIVISLFTPAKPRDELRGLVYRASFHDDEAQDALADRVENLDDEEKGGER